LACPRSRHPEGIQATRCARRMRFEFAARLGYGCAGLTAGKFS
jgi:hypothetical protein